MGEKHIKYIPISPKVDVYSQACHNGSRYSTTISEKAGFYYFLLLPEMRLLFIPVLPGPVQYLLQLNASLHQLIIYLP